MDQLKLERLARIKKRITIVTESQRYIRAEYIVNGQVVARFPKHFVYALGVTDIGEYNRAFDDKFLRVTISK